MSTLGSGRIFFQPEVDAILDGPLSSPTCHEVVSAPDLVAAVAQLAERLQVLQPKEHHGTPTWHLWLPVERGTIEAFGEYEDFEEAGEVSNRGEFIALWNEQYPPHAEVDRLPLRVMLDGERIVVAFAERLVITVDREASTIGGIRFVSREVRGFLTWMLETAAGEVESLSTKPGEHRRRIEAELLPKRRYGKLVRREVWQVVPDIHRYDQELGLAVRERFEALLPQPDPPRRLNTMTVNRFLRMCEIGYDANRYEQLTSGMTAREKYGRMADGRHDGLLDVSPQDDPDAFRRWYRERPRGGHPWEICRGGNATHISLSVLDEDDGWAVWLTGLSGARCVETVRMAVALHEHAIPAHVVSGEDLLRMIRGEDLLGIVPDGVSPRYASSLFPREDRVLQCVQLWALEPHVAELLERIEWYPIELSLPRERGEWG